MPYNPVIIVKYGCHINLDAVGTTAVVKYLYKYMKKSADKIYISKTPENEDEEVDSVKEMIDNRFMSGIESSYCVLNPPMFMTKTVFLRS